jgi:hypothetical protein
MHTRHTLDMLDFEATQKVLGSIGKLGLGIVKGIIEIQPERDHENHANSDIPNVFPHELVKMTTSDLRNNVVDIHLEQLRHSLTEEDIEGFERHQRDLVIAYHQEPRLRSALDLYACVHIPSFEGAWATLERRFKILRDFCRGIATVFPTQRPWNQISRF